MQIEISSKWFKTTTPEQVTANAYAVHYYQSGKVDLNISQLSSTVNRQYKLSITMTPEAALKLASQLTSMANIAMKDDK